MITPKLVGLIVEDHDTCGDKGAKFARIFSREFVGLCCIRITIPLWRSWWLDKVVGVGCTPWVTVVSRWGTWRSWGTGRTWWAWWVIGESTGWSLRAWRPGGKIRGSAWWSWRWAAWWAAWWAA